MSYAITTKIAPSAPLFAPTPVIDTLTGSMIKVTWSALSATDEDTTGGYPITAYQLRWGLVNAGANALDSLVNGIVFSSTQTSRWTWNTNYVYQVLAWNQLGAGVASTNLTILTPTVPNTMSPPTFVYINCLEVKVSWNPFSTLAEQGRTLVTNYNVKFQSTIFLKPWVTVTPGSGYLSNFITIGVSALNAQANPGTTFEIQTNAQNEAGTGSFSTSLRITSPNVPVKTSAPVISASDITPTSITITWTQLADTIANNCNCSITGYVLEWADTSLSYSALTTTTYIGSSFTMTSGFSANTTYNFRLKAQNTQGSGPASDVTQIKSDSVPSGMGPLTAGTINPTNMTFSWDELTDTVKTGGDPIIFYSVEYSSTSATTGFTVLNAGGSKVLTYTHSPGTVFTSGSTHYYRVRAQNSVGMGLTTSYSTVLTMVADKIPQSMGALTLVSINPTNSTISWADLTTDAATGGDPINFYSVEFSSTSSSQGYSVVNTGGSLTMQYTHLYGTVYTSTTIWYRVRARNGVGIATVYSAVLAVTTDTRPTGMNTPVLVECNPQNIAISWPELTSSANGGDLPNFYQVEWSPNNSGWSVLNAGDGFYLSYNYTVNFIFNTTNQYFRIKAQNGVGMSTVYSSTLTVLSDIKPTGMNTPIQVGVDPSGITISWAELTSAANGGDIPIFYQVEWVNGNGNNYDANINTPTYYGWTTLNSGGEKTLQYTHNLTGGAVFPSGSFQYYRIRAKNRVGLSNFVSTAVKIVADQIPSGMTTPTSAASDITPSSVTINWVELTNTALNGGDVPIYYQVEWFSQPTSSYAYSTVNVQTNYYSSTYWTILNPSESLVFSYTHTLTGGAIFPSGSKIWYRLKAKNRVGMGVYTYSTVQEVTADSVPSGMGTLTATDVNPYNVTVSWDDLTTSANGGDIPNFYLLQYYTSETGVWINLTNEANPTKVLTYTHVRSTIFLQSRTHIYQVKPRNGVGWGTAFSPQLTVVPDNWPTCMNTISTHSVDPLTITIRWDDLVQTCNGGDVPFYYMVQWWYNSAWVTLTNEGMGKYTQYSHVMTNSIPFATNSTQQYRVLPKNRVDWGTVYSNVLSVLADEVPTRMNTPTIVSIDPKKISLQWAEITSDADIGRDTIIFYSIEWDQGLGPSVQGNWVALNTDTTKVTSYDHINNAVFPSNVDFNYRVRAKNGVGYGVYSSNLVVRTDSIPFNMNTPTNASIDPTRIVINWEGITAETDTGRDAVIFYQLQYREAPTNAWTNLNSGSMVYTYDHDYSPYFPPGQNVYYRVCAQNGVGMGACSSVLTLLTDQVPTFMNPPEVVYDNIHPFWITITWSPITTDADIGRDTIIFYDLQYNDGTTYGTPEETWTNMMVESDGVQLSFNHTNPTGFPSYTMIYYKLRSKNGIGYGVFSTVLSFMTDSIPFRMKTPITVYINYNAISISWDPITLPEETGSDEIIYYMVQFNDKNCFTYDLIPCSEADNVGTWTEVSQQAVQGSLTSFIHTSATHFSADRDFEYRVCAMNKVGLGACSDPTLTLHTDTVPYPPQMDSANVKIVYNLMTYEFATYLDDEGDQSGKSPVTQYKLQWDNYLLDTYTGDPDQFPWQDIETIPQGATPTLIAAHTVSPSFENGRTIYYRLRAINNVGASYWSDPMQVLTPNVPDKMNSPIISNTDDVTYNTITVNWVGLTLSQNGRDLIQYYRLEWDQGDASLDIETPWTELTDPNSATLQYSFTQSSANPSFANNTYFRYRMAARNGIGMGSYSDPITIISDRTPLQMASPTNGSISPLTIQIYWSDLVRYQETGRDPLTNYKVEYLSDETTGWAQILETTPTTLSFLHTSATILPCNVDRSNYYVKYRVSAKNGVGYGMLSEDLLVLTDTFPKKMDAMAVVGDVVPGQFTVSWTRIDNTIDDDTGRDLVKNYQLQWKEQSTNDWVTLLTAPETQSTFLIKNTTTSNYKLNTYYNLRIAAINNVGMGQYTDLLTVLTDNVPTRMNAPVEDPSTNATYILVTWPTITAEVDTGRDPVLYYRLEWDQGNSTWTWLNPYIEGEEMPLITSYYVTTYDNEVQNGTTYKFKLTPWNNLGYGAESPITNIIPSSPPDKMDTVTTSIVNTDVKIMWAQPNTNGAVITSYLIEIKRSNGAFASSVATCDGSSSTIVAQKWCTVPMATLIAAPFNLAKGALIVVQVMAANLKGFNDTFSDVNTVGAVIETVPDAPPIVQRSSSSTDTYLKVTWNTINANSWQAGGSTCTIKSYNLQRDQGNNWSNGTTTVWTDLQGATPLNTTAQFEKYNDWLVGGWVYKMRTRAQNKYGWGPWSSVQAIRISAIPLAPATITTDNSTTNVAISWSLPTLYSVPALEYNVTILRKTANQWQTPASCVGNDATLISTRACTVPMMTLRTTFQYGYNDTIQIRVNVKTVEGWGPFKQITATTKIQTEPPSPTTVVVNVTADTDDTKIRLTWPALTTYDRWGGYVVDSYELWWQDKDGTFPAELLFTDTRPFLLQYTHTNKGTTPDVGNTAHLTQPIVGGTQYKFKYRGVNIHGQGNFSVDTLVYASTKPDQLDPITTTLTNKTVTISWTPTPNDHKRPVTAYRLRFKAKNGTFVDETNICNGALSSVVSAMKCNAQMTLFTNNLGLAIDDLIVGTVEAMNIMGYSLPSNPNTVGVLAKKLPQTAPTNLIRGVQTNKNAIHLLWTGISSNTDTGGQLVDYKVYYDKGSNNWILLSESTNNDTEYINIDPAVFGVGKSWQFKVAAWNDFGIGPQSSAFVIWTAIVPSGLAEPTTALIPVTYVEEDDMVLVDWTYPADDGGLATSFTIEVKSKSGTWLTVDQPNECSEKGTVTNYVVPLYTTAQATTQCQMAVTKLKSRWGLTVGDTVVSRITAFHVVGSITTSLAGSGTAILPIIPCFRTTFPRVIGGSNQETMINAVDVDLLGNVITGGYSLDSGLLARTAAQSVPIAVYISKGNYYAWGKQIVTTDGTTAGLFTQVLDITFKPDGSQIAMALDKPGYTSGLVIVVLQKDGSLYGSFKESTNLRGKVNTTGLIFDSLGFITAAIDASQDGTDQRKYSIITRFSVASPTATSITPTYYIQGGAVNKVSQSFVLQRIKSDPTNIYASAQLQDKDSNRRAILARLALTNTASPSKYFQYVTTPVSSDYNTDLTFAAVKKMSLFEEELTNYHYIGACLHSMDGFRLHVGYFVFANTLTYGMMVPQNVNRWVCLGIYQRTQTQGFILFNDRSAASPSSYGLFYGKIDYSAKKIEYIPIVNHDGGNNYGGAMFVHTSKFYYWGETQKLVSETTYNFAQQVGFVSLFDQQDSYQCAPSSQQYSFSSATTILLDNIVTANMNWVTTGYTAGPQFAAMSGKSFRPLTLTGGLSNINLKEPMMNNTWCPIVRSPLPAPASISAPVMSNSILSYNPDTTLYPPQEVQFGQFIMNQTCPDGVFYYSTFLSDTSQPLPSFVAFDPTNLKYIFSINSTDHVGTYMIMLQSTIGNNFTNSVQFTIQVASPCLSLQINVPTLAIMPLYDISDLVPLYVDLNWEVVNAPTPSCGPIFFQFKMVNATTGGNVDTSVYSLVNTTNGLQRIKVSTSAIPAAKVWTDLKIEARLQGDLVKVYTYSINITNKCALTQIVPVPIDDWVYYHGRDPIDLNFTWTETVGTCGPIVYHAKVYNPYDLTVNDTLDSAVFLYPRVQTSINETIRIYTWDETKFGLYDIRVWASLGVGGFQQTYITFQLQVIKDPCSYFPYVTSFSEDLTLWVNQTDQVAMIPPFVMNDTNWVCNFTYEIRNGAGNVLDSVFVIKEVANQGDGTNLTLVTTDRTKVDLSPQVVRVKGWPKRQNLTSASFTFRIFVAYFDRTDCPSGKYYSNADDTCLNCVSPCSTCYNATACKWCKAGYIYIESTASCQEIPAPGNPPMQCPVGTTMDPDMPYCRKCSSYCQTCIDYTTCTQCIANYNLANGVCNPNRFCPLGFRFEDGNGCVACPSKCDSCQTASQCTYCSDGYYLDATNHQCTQNCPDGTYGDLKSRVCMLCQPSCKTCVNNNFTCTSCQDVGATKYYLFGNTCVTRCPYLEYFQNETARECTPCKPQCKICVNAIDDCIVCNQGSVISGRECLNSCPEKYYITVIGTCFKCDASCQNCYGSQNSMCSQCVDKQYLTGTTCENKCNAPLFPNEALRTCDNCPYYCNQCTRADNCMKCKSGYQQLPQDCAGEHFLKIGSQFNMSVPIQQEYSNDTFDPTEMAFEIWFKADNILSMNLEIILSLSPYKLRKKAGTAQIQLYYHPYNFCDSSNLKSAQWYHFGVSFSEETGTLNCYLDGNKILTGQAPVSKITTQIVRPKEISFGAAMDKNTNEVAFNGYVKEFRWWKQQRTQFQFLNFKNVALTNIESLQPPNKLLAYWKLDEKRSLTSFTDYSSKGVVSFNPSALNVKLADVVELREIWLKMCPEGSFVYFNETLNLYNCTECHPDCQNCNGDTNTSCTSCNLPFKLLETEQKCIISLSCPAGYWMDKNQDCWPCHEYCSHCYASDQFSCTACKKGFFKAYLIAGCVDSCPSGLYGNYLTQSCSANPTVKSIYPEDGIVIAYGQFIDLYATFAVLNDEPRETYWYNWIITKLNSVVDIAKDATKPYAGEDILRVHLDNNIIEPNNYYNITFYVKGNNTVYNGMIGSMYNIIYIGIAPKGGSCIVAPPQGIATVTEFTIRTQNWIDPDGIQEFKFFYSIDSGKTYLPIPQASFKNQLVTYKFDTVYMTYNARLKCQVKSMKGFISSAETQFVLTRKSSSSSKNDLQKMAVTDVTDVGSSMRKAFQIYQVAQDIGSLKVPDVKTFDLKVGPEQCTEDLCSFNGQCVYDTYTKKYYCQCNGGRVGQNCTFKNQTDINSLKALTLQNAQLYSQFTINNRRILTTDSRVLQSTSTSTSFDYQFLKVISSYTDLMSDDLFDKVHDLVSLRILRLKTDTSSSLDDSLQCLQILSNMLEYIDYDIFTNNQTGSWKGLDNKTDPVKESRVKDNLNRTMYLVGLVRNVTIYKLSFLQTTIQMNTRKISYKQLITNQDTILSMPATDGVKKQMSTYMRVSPANFKDTDDLGLNKTYIVEAIEYSISPFQIDNVDKIATNIYEANMYNQRKTTTENIITKVKIDNLLAPIEFSFPAGDNQNLTDFFKEYNALNPYKNNDKLKRSNMITKSNLTCVYWNAPAARWTKEGCRLSTIDSTHVKCLCTHLSAFAVQFATPKLSIDAPLLNNSTTEATAVKEKTLQLEDIVRWPLDKYFENMQELWQHNRPSFLSFIVKPGVIVLGLFWAMYLSSLIYYSGRDDIRRYNMTKSQNRDDLAELKDNEIQNLTKVIRDLVVRDFLNEHGKFIQMQARKAPKLSKKQLQPPQIKIYEQMSKEEKKKYKKRARRKVFGVPAGLCQRAERYYQRTMKHNNTNPNAKMSFFNDELKNNFWIGLIAKTSKVAPRHVRLAMMYLYAALYISMLTIVFAFQVQEYITNNALFQVIVLSFMCHLLAMFITIPVAMIFRMPLSYRRMIAGVRTKKVNKAFKEIDKLMGCRYAIGYFICFSFYVIMTVLVLVFSLFYPQDYVTGWAFNIILLYLLDLIVFSFGLASIQMANVIISGKVKCWYKVWAAIEVFRYLKNLKG